MAQSNKSAPKCGTITGRVWEIAEGLAQSTGSTPTRGQVLAAGLAEGINHHTITTQYQAWKAYTGRSQAAAPRVAVACVAAPWVK